MFESLVEPHRHIAYNRRKHIDFYVKKLCFYASTVPALPLRQAGVVPKNYWGLRVKNKLPPQPITFLNNPSFPLNGGYFIEGSNQVGVFITALR